MKLKKVLSFCLVVLFLIIIFTFIYFRFIKKQVVFILTYHSIVDNVDNPNSVDITEDYFKRQIKWLYNHGYKTITMDEFFEWKQGNKKIPRKSIMITFDDGWKSTYTKALPVLEKYGFKSNVFVTYSFISNNSTYYMTLNDLKDIEENHRSMQILSHSFNLHTEENSKKDDYEFYSNDIKKVSKLNKNIKYYAYPYGRYNENYKKALRDNGYKLAFTFGPYSSAKKSDDNFEVPRIGIFESTSFFKLKLKLLLMK